jgi:hypothetical protein
MRIDEIVAEFCEVVEPHFSRPESRRRARDYLVALLADLPRKNSSALAAHSRHGSSGGLQWFLNSAVWNADQVLGTARAYLRRQFECPGGVLVADEAFFAKKGAKSAGVAAHVDWRTGRSENCQLAIFLAYVSSRGRALVDRELYLPTEWVSDLARRRVAAVPDAVAYRNKAELTVDMIERARRAGFSFDWLVGFAGCDGDGPLIEYCAAKRIGFLVQVGSEYGVQVDGSRALSVAALAERIPPHAYERHRYGGSDGSAEIDWAAVGLPPDRTPGSQTLLVRRVSGGRGTASFYVFRSPSRPTLGRLIGLAELESAVADCVDDGRRSVGLGDYEVRRYVAWYRHMAMALTASALLAMERSVHGGQTGGLADMTQPVSRLALDRCAGGAGEVRRVDAPAERRVLERRIVAKTVPVDDRGQRPSSGDWRLRQSRPSMPRSGS